MFPHPHQMRRFPTVLVLVLLAACASRPHFDKQVLQLYQPGKPREEIQHGIGSAPLGSVVRPKEGWHAPRRVNHGADSFAAAFEAEKKVEAHRVDVYWIGRHTSIPIVAGGVWFDYLFYDGSDRLLGYRRRFVD
jgi:hypothetical protein